jgi:cellulose synthase operon protein C
MFVRRSLAVSALLSIAATLQICSAADSPLRIPDAMTSPETQRAWELMFSGDTDAALTIFKQQKDDPLASYGLALNALQENDFQQSLELMCKAATLGRSSPWAEVYVEYAYRLMTYCRDPQVFLQLASDAQFKPLLRDILRHHHGNWLLQRGEYSAAAEAFKPLDYVTTWALIGPFDNRDGAGFRTSNDIEKVINFTAPVQGRNRQINWTAPEFRPYDGRLDLNEIFEPRIHVLAYAASYVQAEKSGWAVLRAGCGGACAVWVNEQQAGSVPEYNHFGRDKICAPIFLHQGWNQILVKTAVIEDTDWSFNLRLTKPEGGAIAGLRYDRSVQAQKAYYAETKDRPVEGAAPETADLGLRHHVETILQSQPENVFALATSGMLQKHFNYGNVEDNVAAKPLAKAAALAPKCAWLKLELGAASTDTNESRQALEAAHKLKPKLAAPLEYLASLAARGNLDIIAENYLRELQSTIGEEHMGVSLLVWSELLAERDNDPKVTKRQGIEGGRRAEAYRLTKKFVERHPYFANGWITRIQLERSRTMRRDALQKALSFCGGDAKLRAMHVDDLGSQGEEVAAAEFMAASLPARPCSIGAAIQVANLYRAAGNMPKSIDTLEAMRRSAPESPELLSVLATARHLAGEKDQTVALLKEVLRLKPNSPQAKDYLSRLDDGGRMDRQFFEPYEIALKDLSMPAPEAYPNDNMINILNQEVVRVNRNGSSSRMFHSIGKVLRPAGVYALKQHRIYYEPNRQVVDILRAAVITPDGRELSRADVKDHSTSAISGVDSLIYDEHHLKVVTFSNLEPGSIVDLQYTIRDTGENIYGDFFSDTFYLSDDSPTIKSQYVLDRPKTLEIQSKVFNTDAGAVVLENKDPKRDVVKWELNNTPGRMHERAMPPAIDQFAQLQVTTMKSWQDVGQWYHNLCKHQFDANDEMKKHVAELTKDCKTPTDKLRVIHDWAIKNIRYLGIEFGRNGYKPHRATETYKALYGDCKDTATLLTAMLPLAGIDCRVVLIRTVTAGNVPADSLPMPNIFNHCIAYVPDVEGKSYWIDGTTDFHRLGEVPYSDEGAQVLVVDEKGGGFVPIPRSTPKDNLIEQAITVNVRKDGSATVIQRDTQHGQYAPFMRQRAATPGQYERDAQANAAKRFNGGKMSKFRCADAGEQGAMWVEAEFDAPSLAVPTGEQLALPGSLDPLSLSMRYAGESRRTNDLENWFCWARKSELVYKLEEGLKVATLPEEISIAEPFAKFSRKIRKEGSSVIITDEFELTKSRIAAKDYDKFKAFCNKVDTQMEQKVLLEKK